MKRSVELDDFPYEALECPRCGNRGERPFSAVTVVLIGAGGVPDWITPYPEWPEPNIDCLNCDYFGPIEMFVEGDRPAEQPSHGGGVNDGPGQC
ncbi:MAG: hypothetical protein AB7I38_03760 [Dehalococcoidia bacterium]